jgi:hypothetical protein
MNSEYNVTYGLLINPITNPNGVNTPIHVTVLKINFRYNLWIVNKTNYQSERRLQEPQTRYNINTRSNVLFTQKFVREIFVLGVWRTRMWGKLH